MIRRNIIFSYEENKLLQFLPYFKIHKCPENFPRPPAMYGHHPYFLDYKTEKAQAKKGLTEYSYELSKRPQYNDFEEYPIPDYVVQGYHDTKIMNEILYLVNALCDTYFFYYGFNHMRQAWTIELNKEHKLSYSQEGYIAPEHESELEEITAQKNYEFLDPELIYFKDGEGIKKIIRLNELLDLYYTCENEQLKEDYLNACVVFTKSQELAHFDQSASYVFMVSAIESLISIEFKDEKTKNCDCCGQPMYQVTKKFKDFIDKYGYEVEDFVKNKFYSMRSRISHFGQLLNTSYLRKSFVENQKDFTETYETIMERMTFREFRNLTKICFRTFLFWNMKSN